MSGGDDVAVVGAGIHAFGRHDAGLQVGLHRGAQLGWHAGLQSG